MDIWAGLELYLEFVNADFRDRMILEDLKKAQARDLRYHFHSHTKFLGMQTLPINKKTIHHSYGQKIVITF